MLRKFQGIILLLHCNLNTTGVNEARSVDKQVRNMPKIPNNES
jgi:hypothetical protein